jgi:hypothetical protein
MTTTPARTWVLQAFLFSIGGITFAQFTASTRELVATDTQYIASWVSPPPHALEHALHAPDITHLVKYSTKASTLHFNSDNNSSTNFILRCKLDRVTTSITSIPHQVLRDETATNTDRTADILEGVFASR